MSFKPLFYETISSMLKSNKISLLNLLSFQLAERKAEETIKSDQSNDDSVSKSDFRTPPLSCFSSELTETAPTSFNSIKDVIRKGNYILYILVFYFLC